MEKEEKKAKEEKIELEEISDEQLEEVSGGKQLNPPRVTLYRYDDDVKSRM